MQILQFHISVSVLPNHKACRHEIDLNVFQFLHWLQVLFWFHRKFSILCMKLYNIYLFLCHVFAFDKGLTADMKTEIIPSLVVTCFLEADYIMIWFEIGKEPTFSSATAVQSAARTSSLQVSELTRLNVHNSPPHSKNSDWNPKMPILVNTSVANSTQLNLLL